MNLYDLKKSGEAHLKLAFYAFAILSLSAIVSARAVASDFKTELSSGYDSFMDRYTIVDEDTFDVINEYYIGLGNVVLLGNGKTRFIMRNLFRYGNQTIDDDLNLSFISPLSKEIKFDLKSNLNIKHFQSGSDYSLSNDYRQFNTTARIRKAFGGTYSAALKGRIEILDYADRTEFDYDYKYADAGLELERNDDEGNSLHLGAFAGFRDVPDTTDLSYRRELIDLECYLGQGNRINARLISSADRKDYSSDARSSYWYVVSSAEIEAKVTRRSALSFIGETELTSYDVPSEIYFDTQFIRGGIRFKREIAVLSSVHIEPRVGRMFCRDYAEERYTEGSVVLGVDIFKSTRFWLNASYEPGYRDYLLEENNIYSDFYINRISLIMNLFVPGNTGITLYLNHEPERHTRRDDDFSITLISLELKKSF
ncbi:MAG: hypothetical protein B6D63_03990 [Candidatus Latescibacteria bacterium 4484_7]|nr:MAG: hypothetical protein B6D63_03990 [Candidatus Latescibacteria bacterium 4484_7]RKZ05462.1 MAG: hypothetical protein DRQ05_06380 [bacterium]